MYTNPKENRTSVDHILLEQFRRKGYKCEEILEEDATIFIIKHERKQSDFINQVVNESYKDFFKTN
jgi:hypothetical protein